MINGAKLRSAIAYFEIALGIYPNITAMNLRALALKLLGDWQAAIVAFEEIASLASRTDNTAYLEVAESSLRVCRAAMEQGIPAAFTDLAASAPVEPLVDSAYCQVALSFAVALVAGNYQQAYELLSVSMQETLSPEDLAQAYEAMIEYAHEPVESVDISATMEDWPAKQPDDVGWVYVQIAGESFGEAVTVIVAQQTDELVIREIEWGRP
jgi:tetratricopeptide (TPR) repeat protein